MTKHCPKCKQELPLRFCEVCGADISDKNRNARVCSRYCYSRLPDVMAHSREKALAFSRSPEGKAYRQQWLNRPGNRERMLAYYRDRRARQRAEQQQKQNSDG